MLNAAHSVALASFGHSDDAQSYKQSFNEEAERFKKEAQGKGCGQSFGKIRYIVFIKDRGEGGGPGVFWGKLKYKIAFLYITS